MLNFIETPAIIWIGTAAIVAVILVAVVVAMRTSDGAIMAGLGCVSQRWIAEHSVDAC